MSSTVMLADLSEPPAYLYRQSQGKFQIFHDLNLAHDRQILRKICTPSTLITFAFAHCHGSQGRARAAPPQKIMARHVSTPPLAAMKVTTSRDAGCFH